LGFYLLCPEADGENPAAQTQLRYRRTKTACDYMICESFEIAGLDIAGPYNNDELDSDGLVNGGRICQLQHLQLSNIGL